MPRRPRGPRGGAESAAGIGALILLAAIIRRWDKPISKRRKNAAGTKPRPDPLTAMRARHDVRQTRSKEEDALRHVRVKAPPADASVTHSASYNWGRHEESVHASADGRSFGVIWSSEGYAYMSYSGPEGHHKAPYNVVDGRIIFPDARQQPPSDFARLAAPFLAAMQLEGHFPEYYFVESKA